MKNRNCLIQIWNKMLISPKPSYITAAEKAPDPLLWTWPITFGVLWMWVSPAGSAHPDLPLLPGGQTALSHGHRDLGDKHRSSPGSLLTQVSHSKVCSGFNSWSSAHFK